MTMPCKPWTAIHIVVLLLLSIFAVGLATPSSAQAAPEPFALGMVTHGGRSFTADAVVRYGTPGVTYTLYVAVQNVTTGRHSFPKLCRVRAGVSGACRITMATGNGQSYRAAATIGLSNGMVSYPDFSPTYVARW